MRRAPVQASSWKRLTSQHQKRTGWTVLPVPFRPRQHRIVPPQGGDHRRRYVLVLRYRRAADALPPHCQMLHVEGQARVLWKRIGKPCEWKEPKAPEVRLLFDDVRAATPILTFLRDTRVGRIVPRPSGEGVQGRAVERWTGRERRPGRARPRSAFPSFVFPWCDIFLRGGGFLLFLLFLPFVLPFFSAFWCAGDPTLAGNSLWLRKLDI